MTILVFEDAPVLRAALESGLVPASAQARPLRWSRDPEGRLQVEPSVTIGKSEQDRLKAAGVVVRRTKLERDAGELGCWAELLPATRGAEPEPPLGEVVFVSEGDEGFLRISGELLRLGSEDQRLAFFVDDEGRRHNFCRVADPPYYAILRALDHREGLRAFRPTRPGGRVCIEIGHRHPLAERLEAEPGQLVLIPGSEQGNEPATSKGAANKLTISPQPWLRVPDGPWLDLHEVSHVVLPGVVPWKPIKPDRRLQIDLRLVRAPAARPPTLWVLRERAIDQMETLVRTLPDVIVARLRFAAMNVPDASAPGGERTLVVLRARRNEQEPPALDLDAETYTAVPQVPDLHVPLGHMIDPPLRPARLRELLLDDPERIVWLAPQGQPGTRGRAFVRESLPERSFAPLTEWVDYLVGQAADQLVPWIRSTIFDLDAYTSMQIEWSERPRERERSRDDEAERKQRDRQRTNAPRLETPQLPTLPEVETSVVVEEIPLPAPTVTLTPGEAERQLAQLEQRFCELDTPLDDPQRIPVWAELGSMHARLRRTRDAGLCWVRALWERGPDRGPSGEALAQRWAENEATMLGYPNIDDLLGIVDVLPADLDDSMVRALAARVVLEHERQQSQADKAGQAPRSGLGGEQLSALQRFFASEGDQLDLRALWLVRSALARMAGDDRLALFQTRDLVMSALREGVALSRNIPAFVRTFGSEGDAGDLSLLADELLRMRDEFLTTKRRRSTIESTHPETLTRAYVRLVFGWGLARLGRSQVAREELDAARELLGNPTGPKGDPLHRAAFLAYQARIEQSLDGAPIGAPLSPAPGGPIAAREALQGLERFKYDRLIQLSRILDPRQAVDAFERWNRKDAEPFAGLALLTRPEELAGLFQRMLDALPEFGPERRVRDLVDILGYLEALPDALAVPGLRSVLHRIGELPVEERPRLLRDAVMLAGYYDRPELLAEALGLIQASHAELANTRPAAYAELLTRCAPLLRRAGHHEALARLLAQLEQRIGSAGDLAHVIARLHLAAAQAALGQPDRVQPAFVAAQALLPQLTPGDYQVLLREIAVALSRSSASQAITGARALMQRLPETTDSMSTNSHFCLAVIQLMEAVVLSLASEDLALSEWARRWIEEDEHLLHRRIHRDLARSGR